MCIDRRQFLLSAVAVGAFSVTGCSRGEAFECPPCGCASDGKRFKAPGVCPSCGMTLQPVVSATLGHMPSQLTTGAGRFTLPGGVGRTDDRIDVDYYLPERFAPRSPIVLIVPGAGRNGAEQRNEWIAHARASGALVAALGFPEATYPFAAYQLAGLATDLDLSTMSVERRTRSTVVRIDDAGLTVGFRNAPDAWRFADFDRAFDHLVAASGEKARRPRSGSCPNRLSGRRGTERRRACGCAVDASDPAAR